MVELKTMPVLGTEGNSNPAALHAGKCMTRSNSNGKQTLLFAKFTYIVINRVVLKLKHSALTIAEALPSIERTWKEV